MTLALGGTYDWGTTIEVLPENATNKAVTFASSDPTVASVDEDGVVTSVGAVMGACWITATTDDGDFEAKILIGCDTNAEYTYFELESTTDQDTVMLLLNEGAIFIQDENGDFEEQFTQNMPVFEGKRIACISKTANSLVVMCAWTTSLTGEFRFKKYVEGSFNLAIENLGFTSVITNVNIVSALDCASMDDIKQLAIDQPIQLNAQGCALTIDSIAAILAYHKSIGSGLGELIFEQGSGTNAPYSEWSAQAKADAADLILNGWTITYTA